MKNKHEVISPEQYLNNTLHLIGTKINGEMYIHKDDVIDIMREYSNLKISKNKL